MIVTQDQNAFKYWSPIAYTRFLLYTVTYVLRSTFRHALGRTPKGQTWLASCTIQVLKLIMGLDVINVKQGRVLMNFAVDNVHLKNGTFRQSSRDKWAIKTQAAGWNGYWIPFKDQSSKEKLKDALNQKTSTDVGEGCDLVILGMHGGGMVVGNALMFLANYRAWMKELQISHGIKIGVLTMEYSLSPENPFPGALDECVAAYRYLVEQQNIDPRKIVFCGDSAGANLCLTTSLKIRDEYPHIGLPGAHVLFSPYVMSPDPIKDSMDDYITNNGCRIYTEAYTQNLPKYLTSQFTMPTRANSLAGLPHMLVFVGGIETLRPSIEKFIEKARSDGLDLEVHVKDGMAHDYALVQDVSGPKIIKEANEIIGKFMAAARNRYVEESKTEA